jgi:hypothetical protein
MMMKRITKQKDIDRRTEKKNCMKVKYTYSHAQKLNKSARLYKTLHFLSNHNQDAVKDWYVTIVTYRFHSQNSM